ncbi:MAG: BhlA/UviB family holin-like peptide [Clostridia bacterium]
MMWDQVFKIALSNGIFAVLFVCLLFYQLKDSAAREKKYQQTIEKLSNHLDIVESIDEKVSEIKTNVLSNKKGGAK